MVIPYGHKKNPRLITVGLFKINAKDFNEIVFEIRGFRG